MNTEHKKMSRRRFLCNAASVLGAGFAMGGLDTICKAAANKNQRADYDLAEYDFLMPRVKFNCDGRVSGFWPVYPGADRNLLEEFRKVVRCKVKLPFYCRDDHPIHGEERCFNAVVELTNLAQMRKYPFLFMTAEGSFTLNAIQKENLKKYTEHGGFVLMDDCVYKARADYFFRSSAKHLDDIFGQGTLKEIPREHEIFHNVFDLGTTGLPHMQGVYHPPLGISIDQRLAVFLSSTDLHCGWADRKRKWFGVPGHRKLGRDGYDEAIQMGINIIMYVLSH